MLVTGLLEAACVRYYTHLGRARAAVSVIWLHLLACLVGRGMLQMEVTFDSMAEFESFLSRIPFQEHKAWTQRVASMVVDGSPVWQVC